MSQENVGVCERLVDSLNRRDIKTFLKELHPWVHLFLAAPAMPGGASTVYRGEVGVRAWFRDLAEAFAEFQLEISEFRDVGERVVAIGHLRGVGKEDGAEVELPIGYLLDLMNGKVTRIHDFFDPARVPEAVGLSEYGSQENLEVVRSLYEAAARRESKTVLSIYDTEVEWDGQGHVELIGVGDQVISVVWEGQAGVWTVRDGKVVRVVWFPSRAEALESVGASA